ncbi:uncharacterized protein [Linepithema humile]|uniref:uncharacterized protein n=1 Tax=Linepithema humile TaxID=83485 RepID=UPI00351DB87E
MIESIEEENDASQDRSEFEETYFDIVSRFDQLIIEREVMDAPRQGPQQPTNSLRLPKIELPTFSGGYEEWYTFHDTFQSLIHNVPTISSIQKFHYLRSALRGDAATVIQSLEVSAANYQEAWQMLTARYDNKRLIIQKHIKAIFELAIITKESHVALRALCDGVLKHVRALRALGRSTDQWGDLLVYIITSKLDTNTNKEWENSLSEAEFPTMQNLIEFLERRCHTLEVIQKRAQPAITANVDRNRHSRVSSNVSTQRKECPICHGEHLAFACETFLKMAVYDRIASVKNNKLCLNCLRSTTHQAKDCTSGGCKKCNKKHNTLLHLVAAETTREASDKERSTGIKPANNKITLTSSLSSGTPICDSLKKHTWLSTAVVWVLNYKNEWSTCRVLLDAGSEVNFATRNLTGEHNFNIPPNLRLADSDFHVSADVDLLLGAEVFWDILCVGQIKATIEHPVLQKTLLGWILGGTTAQLQFRNENRTLCHLITNQELDESLTKFWEREECNERPRLTREENSCEEYFVKTTHRTADGQFVVRLPFRMDKIEQLGDSRATALKRFHAMERKLQRDPTLRKQYVQFLREYQQLGHMTRVEHSKLSQPGYYLPHYPVLKGTSLTTKLRVVFDASCKTSTGISMNDVLMVGPVLQPDLLDI